MLPSPGQQRAQLVDFGFARDDAFEDIAQISERLDIVELCRLDQRGNNRPAFGPAIRTGEEMVLGASLIGRMVRSTVFESISTRPSLRNTPSPFQWRSA